MTLSASSDWQGSFDGLMQFADGKEIAYKVSEDAVSGYSTSINGNARDGFTITNTIKSVSKTSSGGGGTPRTYDDSNLALWIILMLASMTGLLAMIFLLRRKKNK